MSIRDKMRPLFRTLDGGLFSEKAGKADVGDAVSKLQAEGGKRMAAGAYLLGHPLKI